MTLQEKAERIMKAVDEVYTIPTYFENRILKEIMKELSEIEKEDKPCTE